MICITSQAGTSLSRVKLQYGDRDISEHSNIAFIDGDMDPWAGGGVLQDISNSMVAINIEHGAHNYDLLFSHKQDLPSVKKHARKKSFIYNCGLKSGEKSC